MSDKRTHIMVDLETLGTGPTAAVVSIGAVVMRKSGLGKEFLRTIDLSAEARHGKADPKSINWWFKQSEEARSALLKESVHPRVAAADFRDWINRVCAGTSPTLWGNSAAFDCVIIRNWMARQRVQLPSTHWNDRCYRTVRQLRTDIKMRRIGTHHGALDDAKSQAKHLRRILSALNLSMDDIE
jgi:exodeoxyribonuclease VIII